MLNFLLDLVFPRRCLGCNKLGKFICDRCQKTIRFYNPDILQRIPNVDGIFVLAYYQGIIRRAVKEIKYRGGFAICQELAELIRRNFMNKYKFDYLVPVPLAKKRLLERGFNQAEKLAKSLKLAPILNCLVRVRETKPQFDLNPGERKINVKSAFVVNRNCRCLNLCLVDDVATTGATLTECAKVLKKAGAKKVYAICVARGG